MEGRPKASWCRWHCLHFVTQKAFQCPACARPDVNGRLALAGAQDERALVPVHQERVESNAEIPKRRCCALSIPMGSDQRVHGTQGFGFRRKGRQHGQNALFVGTVTLRPRRFGRFSTKEERRPPRAGRRLRMYMSSRPSRAKICFEQCRTLRMFNGMSNQPQLSVRRRGHVVFWASLCIPPALQSSHHAGADHGQSNWGNKVGVDF